MKEELIANGKETQFGKSFHNKKIFLGKIGEDEYVTVEEFVDGLFVKYINNTGDLKEGPCFILHLLKQESTDLYNKTI
ncbi:Hypothetical predicted protein [Paramuricea clavata]|uniref:Uncharacterized protein n=1 Tax=Paramuricea clavata TaxID=317549 RepID=A0A6S7IRB8_PARCT|nr:Hypothetical predicted protein [Paramuricea clavata]